jgi:hypothetical protein
MILSVFCQFLFGHDKNRQYHGQRETDKRQTISWPKGNRQKTANIMAKGEVTNDRQYHAFGHDIVCLLSVSLWP